MTRARLLAPVLPLALAVALVGCAGSDPTSAGDATASDAASGAAPTKSQSGSGSPSEPESPALSPSRDSDAGEGQGFRETVVTTAGSEYGEMLFDRTRQAIYLFDKEGSSRPECYGACAAAWPPVLTKGSPRASGQVDAELLGTTRRRDGSMQVTYAGHPLYFYAHEGKNQVLCHNVSEYGGLWLVVTPGGDPAP